MSERQETNKRARVTPTAHAGRVLVAKAGSLYSRRTLLIEKRFHFWPLNT
jgi:hypothetical protein